MSETAADHARWAGMFDGMAEVYDQSGVPFFGPIAEGLVDHLAPHPGERVLDVGAGRGAVTFRLAERVGPTGRVDAIDLAPTMVRLTADEAAARGLGQVRASVDDAADPGGAPASYDVVASSLVLFFLPDPRAALRRWRRLLVPGGRLGVSTFRPWPATWRAIQDVFAEYTTEAPGPGHATDFDDDAATEELFRVAGLEQVRTEGLTWSTPFDGVAQWRAWSTATPMRGLWLRSPASAHDEITARVAEVFEDTRDANGRIHLDVAVRYTLAVAR